MLQTRQHASKGLKSALHWWYSLAGCHPELPYALEGGNDVVNSWQEVVLHEEKQQFLEGLNQVQHKLWKVSLELTEKGEKA